VFGVLAEGATYYNNYVMSRGRFVRAQSDADKAVFELLLEGDVKDLPISRLAGAVTAVSLRSDHANISKRPRPEIELVAGEGIRGDAHSGRLIQHVARVAKDPTKPNLRQVHLIHQEFLEELGGKGFSVEAGDLVENILTLGIPLLDLPRGAILHLGSDAQVKITGLRNPCRQLDGVQDGLMMAVLRKNADGSLDRRSGVMAVVLVGGVVRHGERILVESPPPPYEQLTPV